MENSVHFVLCCTYLKPYLYVLAEPFMDALWDF